MLLAGVMVAAWDSATGYSMGPFSRSNCIWCQIDGHLLLTGFLPLLLFGDAMSLNFHLFKRCFWQCLLLGPTLARCSPLFRPALARCAGTA